MEDDKTKRTLYELSFEDKKAELKVTEAAGDEKGDWRKYLHTGFEQFLEKLLFPMLLILPTACITYNASREVKNSNEITFSQKILDATMPNYTLRKHIAYLDLHKALYDGKSTEILAKTFYNHYKSLLTVYELNNDSLWRDLVLDLYGVRDFKSEFAKNLLEKLKVDDQSTKIGFHFKVLSGDQSYKGKNDSIGNIKTVKKIIEQAKKTRETIAILSPNRKTEKLDTLTTTLDSLVKESMSKTGEADLKLRESIAKTTTELQNEKEKIVTQQIQRQQQQQQQQQQKIQH